MATKQGLTGLIESVDAPKKSSTNATIAPPVFEGLSRKVLPLPVAIDAYNHHMDAIDLHNQLRHNLTCHRRFETRNWCPLAWWLFDVCATNAFVIWRELQSEKARPGRHLHELFEKRLARQFFTLGPVHEPVKMAPQRRCAWGAKHHDECHPTPRNVSKGARMEGREHQQALREVKTGARPPQVRSRNIREGCATCGVRLCIEKGCFSEWHASLLEEIDTI